MSVCVCLRLSVSVSLDARSGVHTQEDSVRMYRVVSLEGVRRAIREAAVTRSPRPLVVAVAVVIVVIVVIVVVVRQGTSECIHISLFIYYILYIDEHQWRQCRRRRRRRARTGRPVERACHCTVLRTIHSTNVLWDSRVERFKSNSNNNNNNHKYIYVIVLSPLRLTNNPFFFFFTVRHSITVRRAVSLYLFISLIQVQPQNMTEIVNSKQRK